jgi:hypothetical protein
VARLVCENIAQRLPKPLAVKIIYNFFHKKALKQFSRFGSFSKKLSKENSRPMSENSPDLVTLLSGVKIEADL